MSEIKNVV